MSFRQLSAILLLILVSTSHAGTVPEKSKGIYGEDGRRDVYEANPAFRPWADSTAALMERDSLRPSNSRTRLTTAIYGREAELCRDERFYRQRTAGFCSGALIAPDLILTAGHCIESAEMCANTQFVFGWKLDKPGRGPRRVLSKDVYGCRKLIISHVRASGADFALVQLDRPVTDRSPLPLNRKREAIAPGTELVVVGHPMGLPTKITEGARVWDSQPAAYFTTDADTYGGNSGSPVLNAQTGLVEGILVRGGKDFEVDWSRGGCVRSYICSSTGPTPHCRGEDISKIAEVIDHLPN